jgi:nicotinamide-nucleotide amidase
VTAESCTGGGIAYACTEIAGSSDWFDRGFVTYSNAAKQQMLSVSDVSLSKHGAVSECIAKEMAIGALAKSEAQISAAITGIAGPSGGTEKIPVGTIWIAFAGKHFAPFAECHHLQGSRTAIREQAILLVLQKLLLLLQ